jgi:hypothetical protein
VPKLKIKINSPFAWYRYRNLFSKSKAEHINVVQLYIRRMNVETYFSKAEHINVVQLYICMMNVETYFSQAEHFVDSTLSLTG